MVDQDTADFGTQLREQLRVLRERKWLILACVVLTTAAALAFSLTRTPEYQATSRVLLQESDLGRILTNLQGGGQLSDPERELATALELATAPAIAQRVVRETDVDLTPQQILDRTTAAGVGNSRVIEFTVRDSDARRAAQVANAYATQYVDFRRDTNREVIDDAEAGVRAQIRDAAGADASVVQALQGQSRQLQLLRQAENGGVIPIQSASTPEGAVSPNPLRTGLLGLVVGLLLGVGLALLRDRLDHRLKREEDVARLLPDVPVIAAIPSWRLEPTQALQHEGFRALQTTLDFLDSDHTVRSLLVTSATVGEGKTTTTLNLALAMAERDESVVVLEADLRRQGLSERLGLENRPGVAQILHGDGTVDDFLVRVPLNDDFTGRSNGRRVAAPALTGTLSVVPAGQAANPHSLLTSERLRRLIEEAQGLADKVVIDGTPLGLLTDMLPIAGRVDAVVVVVHLYHTRRNELKRLADQLAHARIKPFGLVIFGVETDRAYDAYLRRR